MRTPPLRASRDPLCELHLIERRRWGPVASGWCMCSAVLVLGDADVVVGGAGVTST